MSAEVMINGPSADWWAVGCVLFEILTGEVPFKSKDCPAAVEAPQTMPAESRAQWEVYEHMRQAQQTWVNACELTHTTQSGVQHPLLDRVRQCSTDPDQAALFFQTILSPVPQVRVKALEELWCAATLNRMFSETGTNFEAGTAAAMAALQKRNQKRKRGLCAALCACFSAPISQRQEDSICPPPTRVLEAGAVTDDTTQLQTVASSVGSSHDGELETHTMQSAALQTPAQVSLTQKCVRKLKSACRHKLKPSSSAFAQQGFEGRDDQHMIPGDANSPSAAVADSHSSTEHKQDAISKYSLQPGCIHVTVKSQTSATAALPSAGRKQ